MTSSEITLRDYVERSLEEKDRLCRAQMRALEKTVEAAFTAMNKAIDKAEVAQRDYNARSNEFRGQLDDQAHTLMPRTETMVLIKNLEDRMLTMAANMESKIEALRVDTAELRESSSGSEGEGVGRQQMWANLMSLSALALSLVSISVMVAMHLSG